MGVTWQASYAVGVTMIDMHHKELFNRINQLLDACKAGKGTEELGKTLNFLEEYVVTHFDAEEKLMQKYQYPEYNIQRAAHEKFKANLHTFHTKFKTGSGAGATSLLLAIQRETGDWLISHIGKLDRQLGQYLQQIM